LVTDLSEMNNALGASLKRLRLAAGLTQEELAERAGISARTVSDAERGLRALLHQGTARRLASALDLDDAQRREFQALARGPGLSPAEPTPAEGTASPRPTSTYALPAMQARTVTFLLTDIEGSTRLWTAAPDAMRKAIRRHDELLSAAIEAAHGKALTERGEGDSFFAVFASPTDAIAAALAAQLALGDEPWPDGVDIRVRMAIHTGESSDDYRGPEVNKCARLRATGHGGQVLVSAATRILVGDGNPASWSLKDLGEHRLPDLRESEHVYQLLHPQLSKVFPALKSLDVRRHNLPVQLTSLVGREKDLETVVHLIGDHRLVTLTGAGGSGKTRLALQIAADLLESFPDGAWFVDLAPLHEPDLVLKTAALAIQVREETGSALEESLIRHLARKKTLVILDNCEHLRAASAEVAQLMLGAGPGVRVLATSREPLHVRGELTFRVSSLEKSDSVRLFLDRASLAVPGRSSSSEEIDAISTICRRLDGIPLAIELAASRVAVLSLTELDQELQQSFRVLTFEGSVPSRHQTLKATLDWSYELLDTPLQILYRRLSVFPGSFDRAAADAIHGESSLLPLAALVDRSLVVREPGAGHQSRYRLLVPIREHAANLLEVSGESAEIHRRHARYFAAFARQRELLVRGADQRRVLAEYDAERDNIRAALEWSIKLDPETAVTLAASTWFYWLMRDLSREGDSWLRQVVATGAGEIRDRAMALTGIGSLAPNLGDMDTARASLEQAIEMWRTLDDIEHEAMALNNLGMIYLRVEEVPRAAELVQRSADLFKQAGKEPAVMLGNLAGIATLLEDTDASVRYASAALDSAVRDGSPRLIAIAGVRKAAALMWAGDLSAGRSHLRQAIEVARDLGVVDIWMDQIACALELACLTGQPETAVTLFVAGSSLARSIGADHFVPLEVYRRPMEKRLAAASAGLTREQRVAAEERGAGLGPMEALDLALTI
jgi:predicted ATPase/class 3 adenylate cyclase